ncbi:type II toxin-antitoxin system RelE/ParE family toxin [Enterococcus sp. 5H]|uniref:type II toxin-antitoxin system RelE/ParE family toxin n=1 Tax=Enterococcus sp. 5H TaxID=1229490 RepID=UPI0023030161|nr:type II toxin-antitoxin system RelE/ParE family toxin [Enterococcus sp. 5H]
MENSRYSLSIAAQVEKDLNEIIFYLTEPGMYQTNIDQLVEHIFDGLDQLQVHPLSGTPLDTKTVVPTKIRYLIIDDYLLFYEVVFIAYYHLSKIS